MKITKWNPGRVLSPAWAERLGSLFDGTVFTSDLEAGLISPKVDVLEDEKTFTVHADLPGIDEKNLKVELENGQLVLSGERNEEKKTDKGDYHRVERSFGSFYRSIPLPDSVRTDKVEAVYKKGVLTVTIEKEPLEKAKKISVKVG